MIADAVDQAGLRAVLCYEVSDRNGPQAAEAGIEENTRFVRAVDHKRIKGLFGLHANLTLSDQTLAACAEAIGELGCGCHIHVAEHESDQAASLEQGGTRAVTRLADFGLLTDRTIVAHAVHVDSQEIGLLRDSRAWVTHQARSNMNNGVGTQAFERLQHEGVRVGIGTDGIDQAMFAEWQAAYFLHKAANRDPRAAPPGAILNAAQVNAQLAEKHLGLPIGRLEPGAAADVIVLDYEPFTPLTADTLLGHALFGFPGAVVSGTIVAGQILMWERKLYTLDVAQIMAEARAHTPEVWARYAANVPPEMN